MPPPELPSGAGCVWVVLPPDVPLDDARIELRHESGQTRVDPLPLLARCLAPGVWSLWLRAEGQEARALVRVVAGGRQDVTLEPRATKR